MTDDEVIAAAAEEGFELGWRFVNCKPLVGFTRGDDTRFSHYGEERLAISDMRDRLRRGRAFASTLQSGHCACTFSRDTQRSPGQRFGIARAPRCWII